MSKVAENEQLEKLARQYSDFVISRDEFNKKRRSLLDEVDAKYNNRHYVASEIMKEIKSKLKDAVKYVKNYK